MFNGTIEMHFFLPLTRSGRLSHMNDGPAFFKADFTPQETQVREVPRCVFARESLFKNIPSEHPDTNCRCPLRSARCQLRMNEN